MLVCVRWYVAYPLSLRNLEEMMHERGVTVEHDTAITVRQCKYLNVGPLGNVIDEAVDVAPPKVLLDSWREQILGRKRFFKQSVFCRDVD
jgi:hypothetical protein